MANGVRGFQQSESSAESGRGLDMLRVENMNVAIADVQVLRGVSLSLTSGKTRLC